MIRSVLSSVHSTDAWGDTLNATLRLDRFATEQSVALTRFAYQLCGDHQLAEDLVQDAFLSLYRRFGEVLTVDAPIAYARRVIVNGHISRGRRRSQTERAVAELPDPGVVPSGPEEQDAMWQALSGLVERQRAVLVLRYYIGLSDREIGELLDCREGTVRSLAARAFAQLRTHPGLRPTTPEGGQ
jgi:RNA polymerase sigma-70 factor (sigma-E family)